MPLVGGSRYFSSTAVFFNELLKLAISLTVALYEISRNLPPQTPATTLFTALYNSVFSADSWQLAVPAVLYTFQNTLQYLGVSNLDAATFQVTYQLKILTTALFSMLLLGRTLSGRKWLSLLILTIGVAIVQIPTGSSDVAGITTDSRAKFHFPRSLEEFWNTGAETAYKVVKRSATYEGIEEDMGLSHPKMNSTVGLTATVTASIISGLAGVYFEKVLKNSGTSLWIRNVQLSFYSLFPAMIVGCGMMDGEDIAKKGFFAGYNWIVVVAIIFQAFGGIIVALCVQFADNIAKNFATSISIIISVLASIILFDFGLSINVSCFPFLIVHFVERKLTKN
jgi:UDP-galactose transporter